MEPEVVQKKSNKTLWIVLLVILLLALAAAAYWYFMLRDTSEPTAVVTTTKVATSSAKTSTESTQTVDDTALIKKAVAIKSGESEANLEITVSTLEGDFAKGSSNLKGEETGGGYFIATKINGDWVVVHSGQDNPKCSDVNPHNFPVSMVPECLDASGAVVTR